MVNGLRFFNLSKDEIDNLTLAEYEMYDTASAFRQFDNETLLAKQAWYTIQAQSTDKHGKPIYKKFSDFYDAKKIELSLQDKFNITPEAQTRNDIRKEKMMRLRRFQEFKERNNR